MRKKKYKSPTYGMRNEDYVGILNRKIYKTKECKGYKEFLEDIKILKANRKDKGKISMLANMWLRRICEMDKEQLFKFVNNYKKNDLNPFQFEPGYQKEIKEKYEEEEEEM